MKQAIFKGFEASYMRAATPPARMSDEVVALCRDEADAIAYSLRFAKRRYGYTQREVARLCGWQSESCLSDAKKRRRAMPDQYVNLFGYVTGCTLLEQVRHRIVGELRRTGRETENQRADAIVEQMLKAAA